RSRAPGRAGPGSDPGPGGAGDPPRGRSRHRGLSRHRARAPAHPRVSAVLPSAPARAERDGRRSRAGGRGARTRAPGGGRAVRRADPGAGPSMQAPRQAPPAAPSQCPRARRSGELRPGRRRRARRRAKPARNLAERGRGPAVGPPEWRLDSKTVSENAETAPVPEGEPVEPEGPGDERAEGLAEEALRRRDAALQHIRKFGDPVLKSRASEIRSFGPELAREAARMVAIMRDAIGVGLAATQLGVMHRLLVFQAGPDATPTAVANPRIDWLSNEVVVA